MNEIRSEGMHLFGTMTNCSYDRLLWSKGIYKLLEHMPGKVNMRLIPLENNPVIHYCKNPNIENDYGYTGIAVLWESHFSIHTWPYFGELDFDLFSCRTFDYMKVLKVLGCFFKGEFSNCSISNRGNFKNKRGILC
jgi:S-adenosylmethionine/arginine decarboxylase-like enzyme